MYGKLFSTGLKWAQSNFHFHYRPSVGWRYPYSFKCIPHKHREVVWQGYSEGDICTVGTPTGPPDLTPFDFFGGNLKAEVFKRRPRNLLELKQAIREEMQRIPLQPCQRKSLSACSIHCIVNQGHLLSDITVTTMSKTSFRIIE